MHCPTCNNQALSPTKLEHGLPAMSCTQCDGILLSILSYREWLEGEPKFIRNTKSNAAIESDNTKQAIACTKCKKLMTKYKVASNLDNQIDLCLDCADVWFDNGEWELLGQLGLKDHFTTVFNTPWQVKIREEKFQQQYLQDLQQELGEQDFSTAQEFKKWLNQHEHKEEILHFLKRELLA